MLHKDDPWILTAHFNEYNQHGGVFVAVWAKKPNKRMLIGAGVDPQAAASLLLGPKRVGADGRQKWHELDQRMVGEVVMESE